MKPTDPLTTTTKPGVPIDSGKGGVTPYSDEESEDDDESKVPEVMEDKPVPSLPMKPTDPLTTTTKPGVPIDSGKGGVTPYSDEESEDDDDIKVPEVKEDKPVPTLPMKPTDPLTSTADGYIKVPEVKEDKPVPSLPMKPTDPLTTTTKPGVPIDSGKGGVTPYSDEESEDDDDSKVPEVKEDKPVPTLPMKPTDPLTTTTKPGVPIDSGKVGVTPYSDEESENDDDRQVPEVKEDKPVPSLPMKPTDPLTTTTKPGVPINSGKGGVTPYSDEESEDDDDSKIPEVKEDKHVHSLPTKPTDPLTTTTKPGVPIDSGKGGVTPYSDEESEDDDDSKIPEVKEDKPVPSLPMKPTDPLTTTTKPGVPIDSGKGGVTPYSDEESEDDDDSKVPEVKEDKPVPFLPLKPTDPLTTTTKSGVPIDSGKGGVTPYSDEESEDDDDSKVPEVKEDKPVPSLPMKPTDPLTTTSKPGVPIDSGKGGVTPYSDEESEDDDDSKVPEVKEDKPVPSLPMKPTDPLTTTTKPGVPIDSGKGGVTPYSDEESGDDDDSKVPEVKEDKPVPTLPMKPTDPLTSTADGYSKVPEVKEDKPVPSLSMKPTDPLTTSTKPGVSIDSGKGGVIPYSDEESEDDDDSKVPEVKEDKPVPTLPMKPTDPLTTTTKPGVPIDSGKGGVTPYSDEESEDDDDSKIPEVKEDKHVPSLPMKPTDPLTTTTKPGVPTDSGKGGVTPYSDEESEDDDDSKIPEVKEDKPVTSLPMKPTDPLTTTTKPGVPIDSGKGGVTPYSDEESEDDDDSKIPEVKEDKHVPSLPMKPTDPLTTTTKPGVPIDSGKGGVTPYSDEESEDDDDSKIPEVKEDKPVPSLPMKPTDPLTTTTKPGVPIDSGKGGVTPYSDEESEDDDDSKVPEVKEDKPVPSLPMKSIDALTTTTKRGVPIDSGKGGVTPYSDEESEDDDDSKVPEVKEDNPVPSLPMKSTDPLTTATKPGVPIDSGKGGVTPYSDEESEDDDDSKVPEVKEDKPVPSLPMKPTDPLTTTTKPGVPIDSGKGGVTPYSDEESEDDDDSKVPEVKEDKPVPSLPMKPIDPLTTTTKPRVPIDSGKGGVTTYSDEESGDDDDSKVPEVKEDKPVPSLPMKPTDPLTTTTKPGVPIDSGKGGVTPYSDEESEDDDESKVPEVMEDKPVPSLPMKPTDPLTTTTKPGVPIDSGKGGVTPYSDEESEDDDDIKVPEVKEDKPVPTLPMKPTDPLTSTADGYIKVPEVKEDKPVPSLPMKPTDPLTTTTKPGVPIDSGKGGVTPYSDEESEDDDDSKVPEVKEDKPVPTLPMKPTDPLTTTTKPGVPIDSGKVGVTPYSDEESENDDDRQVPEVKEDKPVPSLPMKPTDPLTTTTKPGVPINSGKGGVTPYSDEESEDDDDSKIPEVKEDKHVHSLPTKPTDPLTTTTKPGVPIDSGKGGVTPYSDEESEDDDDSKIPEVKEDKPVPSLPMKPTDPLTTTTKPGVPIDSGKGGVTPYSDEESEDDDDSKVPEVKEDKPVPSLPMKSTDPLTTTTKPGVPIDSGKGGVTPYSDEESDDDDDSKVPEVKEDKPVPTLPMKPTDPLTSTADGYIKVPEVKEDKPKSKDGSEGMPVIVEGYVVPLLSGKSPKFSASGRPGQSDDDSEKEDISNAIIEESSVKLHGADEPPVGNGRAIAYFVDLKESRDSVSQKVRKPRIKKSLPTESTPKISIESKTAKSTSSNKYTSSNTRKVKTIVKDVPKTKLPTQSRKQITDKVFPETKSKPSRESDSPTTRKYERVITDATNISALNNQIRLERTLSPLPKQTFLDTSESLSRSTTPRPRIRTDVTRVPQNQTLRSFSPPPNHPKANYSGITSVYAHTRKAQVVPPRTKKPKEAPISRSSTPNDDSQRRRLKTPTPSGATHHYMQPTIAHSRRYGSLGRAESNVSLDDKSISKSTKTTSQTKVPTPIKKTRSERLNFQSNKYSSSKESILSTASKSKEDKPKMTDNRKRLTRTSRTQISAQITKEKSVKSSEKIERFTRSIMGSTTANVSYVRQISHDRSSAEKKTPLKPKTKAKAIEDSNRKKTTTSQSTTPVKETRTTTTKVPVRTAAPKPNRPDETGKTPRPIKSKPTGGQSVKRSTPSGVDAKEKINKTVDLKVQKKLKNTANQSSTSTTSSSVSTSSTSRTMQTRKTTSSTSVSTVKRDSQITNKSEKELLNARLAEKKSIAHATTTRVSTVRLHREPIASTLVSTVVLNDDNDSESNARSIRSNESTKSSSSSAGSRKVITSEVFTKTCGPDKPFEVIYRQPDVDYISMMRPQSVEQRCVYEHDVSFIDTTDSSLSDSVALPIFTSDQDRLCIASPGSPKPTRSPFALIEETLRRQQAGGFALDPTLQRQFEAVDMLTSASGSPLPPLGADDDATKGKLFY
ncbi:mucin-2-like [Musca domestica]|uniref:Mucin-2-like n=1 Tax=Musca domestica TaxID=7370 RepID=A0ABM3VQ29_MUSDO|nr:mucin-2-like [Musca domestica]